MAQTRHTSHKRLGILGCLAYEFQLDDHYTRKTGMAQILSQPSSRTPISRSYRLFANRLLAFFIFAHPR